MDNTALKYFREFSVTKSTSLIIAILPIFLNDYKNISVQNIVLISSYFFLLPILLEIPLGVLADKLGAKRIISFGLILFILAFLFLLSVEGELSYFLYMLLITTASSSFSGAEDSLLLNIVKDKKQLFFIKSQINSYVYKITSLFIIIGGVLYYFFPALPMIIQIIFLIYSYWSINKISLKDFEINQKSENIINILKHTKSEMKDFYVIILMLLIGLSSFLVLLNNRTVQIQLAQNLYIAKPIIVSVLFIIGNLFSIYALKLFKTIFNKFSTPMLPILILGVNAVLSYLFMSFNSIYFIVFGFLLLCCFKAGYRSYLSSILISLFKNNHAVASIMSISSIITAIIGFILSILYTKIFVSFGDINFKIAVFTFLIFIIVIFTLWYFQKNYQEIFPKNALSNKRHFLLRKHNHFSYIQYYPTSVTINQNITDINIIKSLYPSPKIYQISKNSIEWEYINGDVLSSLNLDKQLIIIEQIKELFINRLKSNIIFSHGDLHPDNIIVKEKDFYVLDWDLCGNYDIYFDILTLFTSPKLKISIVDRLFFLKQILKLSDIELKEKVRQFILFKINHLTNFNNSYITEIIINYKKLLKDLNATK